jgi:phage terminase small subunit
MLDVAKSGLLDACALSDPIKIRDVLREHEKFGPAVERDREQVMRRIETIHDIAAKEMIEMASRKVVTETESSALLEKYAEWGSDPVHAELKKARDALRSKQAFLATGTMDRLRRLGAVEEDPAVLNQAIEEFKDRAEELGDAYVAITSRRDQLKDEVIAKINDAKALDDPVAMTRIITESEPFGELVERDRNGLKEDVQKLYKSVAGELEKLATATEVDFVQVELQCEKYKQWPEEHQTGIKDALAKLDKKRDELVTVAKDKILQLCGEADPVAIANGLVEFEDYGPSLDEQRRTAVTRRQFLIAEAQRTIRNLSTNKKPAALSRSRRSC